MQEEFPLVSILAVSYNQERYVIDALNSIKEQTYPNIQLIIADDGSKDRTKELIQQWITANWPDAIFLNHPVNMGVTKNLNSGLPYIKGKYYQFIGCEDIMMPFKVSMQVKLLEENPQHSIVYSDMYRMNEENEIEAQTHFQRNNYNVPASGNIYDKLIERCFVSTPTALMRIEVLKALGGDNEALEINDYDFWIKASKQFSFLYHPDVTMKYRILMHSLSNRKGILGFKNNFLVYYLNYDSRKPYRQLFNQRLLFNAKNLFHLKYKEGFNYFLKAFIKTKQPVLFYFALRSLPFFFARQNNIK